MNLYPNDLGEWVSREVQQERTLANRGNTVGWISVGSLVLCVLGMGLGCCRPHFVSASVLDFVSASVFAVFGMLFLGSWLAYMGLLQQAQSTAGGHKPQVLSYEHQVLDYELERVKARATDALGRNYLDLALSVVKLPATKDEAADLEVRDAMTALGTALEALPPELPTADDDPAALRAEAQAQMENAQGEADAVVAASRRRRAESLLRRADTSARTLLLLRRNRALREEVGEQIQALGTSLTALQVGGRQSTPELSGLAASIHRVALEANAVTVARTEVDTLLSQPVQSREEAQAVRVSL